MNYSPGEQLSPLVDWLNLHWHPLFALISNVVDMPARPWL